MSNARRQTKSRAKGKMKAEAKLVQGPLDPALRRRGNKAGKGRNSLPQGHISRTHDRSTSD